MPDRDGRGPRGRSPRPSVPKGGKRLGPCDPMGSIVQHNKDTSDMLKKIFSNPKKK